MNDREELIEWLRQINIKPTYTQEELEDMRRLKGQMAAVGEAGVIAFLCNAGVHSFGITGCHRMPYNF